MGVGGRFNRVAGIAVNYIKANRLEGVALGKNSKESNSFGLPKCVGGGTM
jgi:hypothetical protein